MIFRSIFNIFGTCSSSYSLVEEPDCYQVLPLVDDCRNDTAPPKAQNHSSQQILSASIQDKCIAFGECQLLSCKVL